MGALGIGRDGEGWEGWEGLELMPNAQCEHAPCPMPDAQFLTEYYDKFQSNSI
ncbi:MAG: hypothetical protein F6J93_34520 [Oscillatoria sp. SIO1A7]|nr:hypothetical protein [Oscillatoria sp. SIO1A7]